MNYDKEKGIKVFSAFNGMNCARIALDKLGIEVDKYYSSEIDKYAIQVTQHNHPDTIQLGDIRDIKGSDLGHIDLICGGSPCQGFSLAGKMLNFDDPRSKLFFEFFRIYKELKAINPNIKFLLENVWMKKWCQDVISRYLNVHPVMINSSLLSAQNRDRWYWTNIKFNLKIKDKGLVLRDILESEVDEKYYLTDRIINGFLGKTPEWVKCFKPHLDFEKCDTITARYHKSAITDPYIIQRIPIQLNESKESGGMQPFQHNRVYDSFSVSPCLDTDAGRKNVLIGQKIRRLTPLECERLQTVPENFTLIVSDTQRYKMLGNGWTVDIIAEIFKGLKEEVKTNNRQYATELF